MLHFAVFSISLFRRFAFLYILLTKHKVAFNILIFCHLACDPAFADLARQFCWYDAKCSLQIRILWCHLLPQRNKTGELDQIGHTSIICMFFGDLCNRLRKCAIKAKKALTVSRARLKLVSLLSKSIDHLIWIRFSSSIDFIQKYLSNSYFWSTGKGY